MLLAGKALENGQAGASAAFAERHEDTGEDEGGEKGEQASDYAGDEAKRRRASSVIFGCWLCTRAGRSSCAWLHTV